MQERVPLGTLLATIRTTYPLTKTYCVTVHTRTGHEGQEGM